MALLGVAILASCATKDSQPAAPTPVSKTEQPCFSNPDPERRFEILYPLEGMAIGAGTTTRVLWHVDGACGVWYAAVEAWFDNQYCVIGSGEACHSMVWCAPQEACDRIRLRVTLWDDLGLIGTREVRVRQAPRAEEPLRPVRDLDAARGPADGPE